MAEDKSGGQVDVIGDMLKKSAEAQNKVREKGAIYSGAKEGGEAAPIGSMSKIKPQTSSAVGGTNTKDSVSLSPEAQGKE